MQLLWAEHQDIREVTSTPDRDTVEKYLDTPPIRIAVLLHKSMPFFFKEVVHTPPTCMTIHLPFVSRCWNRSIRGRGRWDPPLSTDGQPRYTKLEKLSCAQTNIKSSNVRAGEHHTKTLIPKSIYTCLCVICCNVNGVTPIGCFVHGPLALRTYPSNNKLTKNKSGK